MKPWAKLELQASERLALEDGWSMANDAAVADEQRLRFAYAFASAARVPGFVQDRAAGVLNRCRRLLELGPVAIVWLEWELRPRPRASRPVCFLLRGPMHGLALGPRLGGGFRLEGEVSVPGLRGALRALPQSEFVFVRWDLPAARREFVIAHEMKHLWFADNDRGQSYEEEEAACNVFAQEALRVR